MTSAISAHGTVLIWDYCKLLEMVNIGGLSQSRDTVDVTSHDSPNQFREYIAGLGDGGEVSLEGNLLTTDTLGQIALHTDLQAGSTKSAFLLLPMSVGQAMSFNAIATRFEPSFPHDGKSSVSMSLKVTWKPTLLTSQSVGMTGLTGIEETESNPLIITPDIAVGTYEYECTVDTDSTWVKLTVTADSHTIYVNGASQDSGVQGDEIALSAAGIDTVIHILVYESNKAPRLYKLIVHRLEAEE